jgi:hypothetical protein
MFGGLGANGDLGDTWIWNGSGWIHARLALSPHSRDSASMVFDPKLHGLVMIGGSPNAPVSPAEQADLAATWLWTGAAWQRLSTEHTPTPNDMLDQSLVGRVAYDADTGRVVLVTAEGETHFEACSTETWTFDGSDWTLEHPITPLPAAVRALVDEPQSGHVIAVLAPRPAVVPVGWVSTSCPGGSPQGRALPESSTWRWNGASWTEVRAGTEPGGDRLAPGPNGDSIGLDAVSGRAMTLTDNNEQLWAWNGTRWSAVNATGTRPAPRSYSLQSVDAQGHVVLYGGVDEANGLVLSDTWVWDGSRWTQWQGPAPATSSPSPVAFTPPAS